MATNPDAQPRRTLYDSIADEVGRYPQGLTADDIARSLGMKLNVVQGCCSKMAQAGMLKRLKQKRIVYRTIAKHHLVYVLPE